MKTILEVKQELLDAMSYLLDISKRTVIDAFGVKHLADAYEFLEHVEIRKEFERLAEELKKRDLEVSKMESKLVEVMKYTEQCQKVVRERDAVILSLENTVKNLSAVKNDE